MMGVLLPGQPFVLGIRHPSACYEIRVPVCCSKASAAAPIRRRGLALCLPGSVRPTQLQSLVTCRRLVTLAAQNSDRESSPDSDRSQGGWLSQWFSRVTGTPPSGADKASGPVPRSSSRDKRTRKDDSSTSEAGTSSASKTTAAPDHGAHLPSNLIADWTCKRSQVRHMRTLLT